MNSRTTSHEIFDARIAAIHRAAETGGDEMDVRHEEFRALVEAFLDQDFDSGLLAQVEFQQIQLHQAQNELAQALAAHRIQPITYLEEVNRAHARAAERCELILGKQNFAKLFGVTASEAGPYIDKEIFLAELSQTTPITYTNP